MREFDLGRAVPRTEDDPLLRGRGRYTDDIVLPRQSYLHVLRSPHAAARIRRIDSATATAAPGVLALLTGAEAVADGLGTFSSAVPRKRPDGSLAPLGIGHFDMPATPERLWRAISRR